MTYSIITLQVRNEPCFAFAKVAEEGNAFPENSEWVWNQIRMCQDGEGEEDCPCQQREFHDLDCWLYCEYMVYQGLIQVDEAEARRLYLGYVLCLLDEDTIAACSIDQ